jgi:hypothetical protein
MLGILLNDRECRELDYMLRKELDEMQLDLSDSRIDGDMKYAIERRYKLVFRIFARLATPGELSSYVLHRKNKLSPGQ